jgi:hypothetical protein
MTYTVSVKALTRNQAFISYVGLLDQAFIQAERVFELGVYMVKYGTMNTYNTPISGEN